MNGANPGQYSIIADNCSNTSVTPSETCTVDVKFSPTSAGAKAASLDFVDNASGSPQSISLSGTGTTVPPVTGVSFTPIGKDKTLVQWAGSLGATGYEVYVNGKLVCTTGPDTFYCQISGVYGPDAKISVRALAPGGHSSPTATAEYSKSVKPVKFGTLHFRPDSSKLTKHDRKKLRKYAIVLHEQGFKTLTINGYTARIPGKGDPKWRKELSMDRALNTREYLQTRLDKLGSKIKIRVVGHGGKHPVASNDTAAGQKKNRRAEIDLN